MRVYACRYSPFCCALPVGSAFDVGVHVTVDRRSVEFRPWNGVGCVGRGFEGETNNHHEGDDASDAIGPTASRGRVTLFDVLFLQRLADEPTHDHQNDNDGNDGADKPHHVAVKTLKESLQGKRGRWCHWTLHLRLFQTDFSGLLHAPLSVENSLLNCNFSNMK